MRKVTNFHLQTNYFSKKFEVVSDTHELNPIRIKFPF